jgi:uncharacterized membrane protein
MPPKRPSKRSKRFKSLQSIFFTGVLLLSPLAVTTLIVISFVGWVADHSPFGGAGGVVLAMAIAVGLIFLVGWISRTALGSLLSLVDDMLTKVPGVGVIYGYIHDMVHGLGGADQRFRQPVWVFPYPGSKMKMIGFITREDLGVLGLKNEVAVFVTFGYSISGVLVMLPRSQVKPLKTKSKDLLAFVATGGLTGAHMPKPDQDDEAPGPQAKTARKRP